MNEEEFITLVGDSEDEAIIRLNYGAFLGETKDWLMKMTEPTTSLNNLLEEWDKYNPSDEELRDYFESLAEYQTEALAGLFTLIQKNAKFLYGKEFGLNSFHVPGCNCEMHERQEEEE